MKGIIFSIFLLLVISFLEFAFAHPIILETFPPSYMQEAVNNDTKNFVVSYFVKMLVSVIVCVMSITVFIVYREELRLWFKDKFSIYYKEKQIE